MKQGRDVPEEAGLIWWRMAGKREVEKCAAKVVCKHFEWPIIVLNPESQFASNIYKQWVSLSYVEVARPPFGYFLLEYVCPFFSHLVSFFFSKFSSFNKQQLFSLLVESSKLYGGGDTDDYIHLLLWVMCLMPVNCLMTSSEAAKPSSSLFHHQWLEVLTSEWVPLKCLNK